MFGQMSGTFIGDSAVFEPEAAEFGECGEHFCTAVENARAAEFESLQVRQFCQMAKPFARNHRASTKIDHFEFGEVRKMRKARVGKIVVKENELFEIGHLRQFRQGIVIQIGAASQVQYLEFGKLLEVRGTVVGNLGVFQNECRQLGIVFQLGDARIGNVRSPERKARKLRKCREERYLGIAEFGVMEIELDYVSVGILFHRRAAREEGLGRLVGGRGGFGDGGKRGDEHQQANRSFHPQLFLAVEHRGFLAKAASGRGADRTAKGLPLS